MDDSGAGRKAVSRDLTFLTRQGCPLCDEVLELVVRYAPGAVEVVDIDLDLDLIERYDELVPVVLDATGQVLAAGPLTLREVKRLMRRVNG